MTETQRQERNGRLVYTEILTCQTSLVEACLSGDIFDYDDVENLYKEEPEEPDLPDEDDFLSHEDYQLEMKIYTEDLQAYEEYDGYAAEVYEWWLVSSWMLSKLRAINEVIIDNEYGKWWGRCCTGQAIKLDQTIDKVIETMSDNAFYAQLDENDS